MSCYAFYRSSPPQAGRDGEAGSEAGRRYSAKMRRATREVKAACLPASATAPLPSTRRGGGEVMLLFGISTVARRRDFFAATLLPSRRAEFIFSLPASVVLRMSVRDIYFSDVILLQPVCPRESPPPDAMLPPPA